MEQKEQKSKWYVIHVYSGSEGRVAELIREKAAKKGFVDKIEEILIPTEDIVEIKAGEKVKVNKKYFPGYILVKMFFGDDIWHVIRGIPKVSGFLGTKKGPSVVSEAEVKKIIAQLKKSVDSPRSAVLYDVGDNVKVIDGPFVSFSGFVEEVEDDKQRLKVSIMVFGRATPITLESSQVEKV